MSFIKITIKNSESCIVPLIINTTDIRRIESNVNNKAYILFYDGHTIVTQEFFDQIEEMLIN